MAGLLKKYKNESDCFVMPTNISSYKASCHAYEGGISEDLRYFKFEMFETPPIVRVTNTLT